MIYVANYNNGYIMKFNPDTSYNSSFTSTNPALTKPTGIAVTADGYVYVISNDKKLVFKFKTDGTDITSFGSSWFNYAPSDIAVDSNDNVYVLCPNGIIYKCNSSGTTCVAVVTGINNPCGVAVASDGTIWTTYQSTYECVASYNQTGTQIGQWWWAYTFDSSSGLALSPDGYIAISDNSYNSNFIVSFNTQNHTFSSFGSSSGRTH